jgi:NADPH-dependent ferric siderophore reductase
VSTRAATYDATVIRREQLSEHFVRLVLAVDGFVSSGVPDEWVALTIPGQFQTRYYTVRSYADGELTLDVVVHDHGLVTEWASGDCVGDVVTVSEPKASFALPDDAQWLLLVGDLTALPAIARIIETVDGLDRLDQRVKAWVEVPVEPIRSYVDGDISWSVPPAGVETATSALVEAIEWPDGPGYFWMAGESAQMRAIRKHLMRDLKLPSSAYDVMGYWRGGGHQRQPRAVDPGPIWRAGKAAGKSDEQIWADYDAAREASGE